MVAKASKRTSTTAAVATSPPKKSRVDPMFAGILATLQGSDQLNDHCRDMLIAMATPSLSKPKCERHDMQQLGVSMIEETLQAHKRELIEAAEVTRQELSDLEGSKSALLQHVADAEASLAEKEAAKTAACSAHEQAKEARQAAEKALEEARELQEEVEGVHAALEKEKVSIDSAYQEHFKAPMDNNEGPKHNFLQSFIQNLGFEESFISALPSSCVKTKEQRGGFDDLVVTELGKALVAKIAALEKSLADKASDVSERKACVVSTEKSVEDKKHTEETTAADSEAATVARSEAEAEVSKASEEWTTFEPRVHEATDNYNLQDTKRKDFEDGPLNSFETLRDKETPMQVEVEAATAGA
jgi:hypothetical protein